MSTWAVLSRTVRGASLAGLAVLGAAARAEWVTFVDETALRLQAAADVGAADVAEKAYAWGDLDHDGDVDLVVVRKEPFATAGKRANVLLMNEGGVLVDRTAEYATAADVVGDQGFLTPTNDRDVALVDVDLDGWLDVVTSTTISDGDPEEIGQPRVYRNQGQDAAGVWLGLRFENDRIPPLLSAAGQPGFNPRFASVAVGDVTGDGYPDLYFIDYDSSKSGGPLESPEAEFNDRLLINAGASSPGYFTDGTASRFSGTVPGPGTEFPVSDFGAAADIADMNGDGKADIVKQTTDNPLYIGVAYNALGAGTPQGFFDTYDAPYVASPYFVSAGDLNHDDRLDLVVTDAGSDRYLLNQGNGPAGFPTFVSHLFSFANDSGGGAPTDEGFGGESLIVDLDGDGWNDVLISDIALDIVGCVRRLHIYRNLGGEPGGEVVLQEQTSGPGCMVFQGNPPSCTVAGIPSNMLEGTFGTAVFDLDGDGAKDLVVGRCTGTQVYVRAGGGSPGGAGSVPELLVAKEPNGRLNLSWGPSCALADIDYEIYEGVLGDFASHVPKVCTTGGSLSKKFIPGAGNRYYLVVPNNGSVEGSYGADGAGLPRPASPVPCLPQAVSSCE